MRFAYKDLVRKAGFIYGPGPAGFFIKRFRKSGFSEAELIDLMARTDFSLNKSDEPISLKEKCGIVKQSVEGVHYSDWAPVIIGLVLTIETGLSVNEWTDQTPVFFCGLPLVLVKSSAYLILLLVYVCARFRFEQGKSALLCALEHIDAIEKAKQGGEAK